MCLEGGMASNEEELEFTRANGQVVRFTTRIKAGLSTEELGAARTTGAQGRRPFAVAACRPFCAS